MESDRRIAFLCAGLGAVFLWLRDLSWLAYSDQVLPVAFVIPLIWWLGRPWQFPTRIRLSTPAILGCCGLSVVGMGLDSTFLLSIAWAIAVALVVDQRKRHSGSYWWELLPVLALAFPWMSREFQWLGWWFRISGAWCAENLFTLVGCDVLRQGTRFWVNGTGIDVEPACAGLNSMQILFVAGLATITCILRLEVRMRFVLPVLLVAIWLANTARLIVISIVAMQSAEFASGWFHDVGGAVVLVLALFLSAGLLSLLKKLFPPLPPAEAVL